LIREATLCNKKAIALSFAFYDRDIKPSKIKNACKMGNITFFHMRLYILGCSYIDNFDDIPNEAIKVIDKLMEINEWQPAGLYNINVPLVEEECSVKVTNVYKTSYGSLFKPVTLRTATQEETNNESVELSVREEAERGEPLEYRFAPDIKVLSSISDAEVGTDTWAVHNKHISGELNLQA
jgi:tubulin--tyrosine ligase